MRLLVTGGSGVLGRALLPLAEADGHQVRAPGHAELDLFDPPAVAAAMRGADAVLHLATRIQPLDKMDQSGMWTENDRLRAEASVILVDAALAAEAKTYIQPTVNRLDPDRARRHRRQDQRTQFLTNDGTLILMRYEVGVIRGDEEFSRALASGRETTFADQYMCMTPQFEVSNDTCGWLTQDLFIGRGRLAGPKRIEYELYRVI